MTIADPCNGRGGGGLEKERQKGKGTGNFCLQPKACTWTPDATTSAIL